MSDDENEFNMPMRCLQEVVLKDDGFDVSQALNHEYWKDTQEPWSRKIGVYHPSAMKGCRRALYYDRIGVPPVPNVDSNLAAIFAIGHALHDMIQSKLVGTNHAGKIEEEVSLSCPELHMKGSCDLVSTDPDWVIEIKTISDAGYKTLTKPKEEHVWQVHCYMFMSDIPRAQLLYINKNSGRRRMFRVRFDNDVWEQILAVINYVEEHVEKGVAPEREVNSYWCRSCKFKHICEPDI